jgi:fumarate hydratase class II
MIAAYAILKKAAANANHTGKRLDEQRYQLIVEVCDEILSGRHHNMFPLHVWMTGSGTKFNMNVNEVISNRSCQLAGTPLASKTKAYSQRRLFAKWAKKPSGQSSSRYPIPRVVRRPNLQTS